MSCTARNKSSVLQKDFVSNKREIKVEVVRVSLALERLSHEDDQAAQLLSPWLLLRTSYPWFGKQFSPKESDFSQGEH